MSGALLAAAGAVHQLHTGGGGGLSTGAIVVAVLAGVLALACVAWALARAYAWEPRWSVSLRHSLAEAGFRASATWSELADWLRFGR